MAAGTGGGRVHDRAPVPSAELAALATRLCAAMDATINGRAAEYGLTRADYDVLAALRGSGPRMRLKPTELQVRCRLSSGGTSNVVRRMTESGYVVREADLHDGRSAWAQLTEEGLLVTARIQDGIDSVHDRRLDRLPPGVVDALSALLAQTVAVLEADD
ncbi:MarR family winged helix-turn-helix transcriptional regulator [Streptomyces sp. NPDC091272]|uniref:MarR family winged helix-turn-helix transcriptional regulator n=1 Tax=Streptomyces sp. NPDC091272 TaxID=3365981 RepID=UPI00381C08B7